jgi:hypothetical protein
MATLDIEQLVPTPMRPTDFETIPRCGVDLYLRRLADWKIRYYGLGVPAASAALQAVAICRHRLHPRYPLRLYYDWSVEYHCQALCYSSDAACLLVHLAVVRRHCLRPPLLHLLLLPVAAAPVAAAPVARAPWPK